MSLQQQVLYLLGQRDLSKRDVSQILLGYQTIDCYAEIHGRTGTLNRETRHDIVLNSRLRDASSAGYYPRK